MYQNIHQPVNTLRKTSVATGGLCKIFYFKLEDVEHWPKIDPQTGVLAEAIQLKPGAQLHWCEATQSDKAFVEDMKVSPAGPYMDIQVNGIVAGNSAANTLIGDTMKYHQFGLIVHELDGMKRLIGSPDSGADFQFTYKSGDIHNSRLRTVKWSWQHTNAAPVYEATAFNIIIDGTPITAGSMTMIARFRVGAVGAPMQDGDTTYTNPLLAGKRVLVIASSMYVPVDYGDGAIDFTGSIERHIQKTLSGTTLSFIGSVVVNEIIEIYAID